MNIKFVVNDYMLVWSLLFQASITEAIHKLKQKLWSNYKDEYNATYNDKNLILKEGKDFIPNDDTIYNLVIETKEYEKIKKAVEKYRLELTKLWDSKTIKVENELKSILKKDLSEYIVYTVDNNLDFIDGNKLSTTKKNAIILGKKIDKKDTNNLILKLSYEIIIKELKEYKGVNKIIADAIIDLAINNELATRVSKKSCYFNGHANLLHIKRQIYPYWLMYLGVKKDEMTKYMTRDKIAFDIEMFPYYEKLATIDLDEFIEFCIKNKKYMVKEEQLEII